MLPGERLMKWHRVGLALVASSLVVPLSGDTATAPVDRFFGEYVGETVSDNPYGIGTRDVGVKIEPSANGFTVTWTIVQGNAVGRMTRGEYSIEFQPTPRPGIYGSAMGFDVFGNGSPWTRSGAIHTSGPASRAPR